MPSRTKFDKTDEMIAERRQGTGKMPDDMPKWMASTITNIDKWSRWIGNVVCWISMPLMFAMVYTNVCNGLRGSSKKIIFSSNNVGVRYEQIFLWRFIYAWRWIRSF